MHIDDEFSERFLEDVDSLVTSQKRNRLSKSKVIQKWISFYKQWFSLDLNIEDFRELGEPTIGWIIIVVPKEVTLQKCFDVLSKRIKNFEVYLKDPDVRVMKARQKNDSYITHESYPNTLLELLVYDLFSLFQGKKIVNKVQTNRFKFNCSYVENHKQIYVTATIQLPWRKDKKGKYTIPPPYKLSKLEYQIWCHS